MSSYNNPPPPPQGNHPTLRSRCSSEKGVVGSTPAQAVIKRRPSSFFVNQQGKEYNLEGYAGETLAFWILLGILIILVLGNTILTCLIFGVVRVGTRMESIEVYIDIYFFFVFFLFRRIIDFLFLVSATYAKILWRDGPGRDYQEGWNPPRLS
jgi:hypothetical protein